MFKLFKRIVKENRNIDTSTWRDAFNRQSKQSLKVENLKIIAPADIKLCSHLNLPEKVRNRLQCLIVDRYYSRSEFIVEPFLKIIQDEGLNVTFPNELIELLNSRRKRGICSEKQIAEVYICHEYNILHNRIELEKFIELGIKKVKISTCKDHNVCQKCKEKEDKIYNIKSLPVLPLCWECRCLYLPIIK